MPAVSVLLPVRNSAKTLSQAIDSLCRQTMPDFEVIAIDDGSTDESLSVLQEFARKDERIRVVSVPSAGGLAAALNVGIGLSASPLLARMDADDVCADDRLARQLEFMRMNPTVDVLGTWAAEIDSSGQELRIRRMPVEHAEIARLLWANPMIHPSVMFRKERIIMAGSYRLDAQRAEDYDLWFRCAAAGLVFANLPEPLLRYRTHVGAPKGGWRATVARIQIGLRGCRLLNTPMRYRIGVLGIAAKHLVLSLPVDARRPLEALLRRVDPRANR